MSTNTPCYLLELPVELRSLVLGYLFQDARIMFSKKSGLLKPSDKPKWLVIQHNTNVSILATCRFLRREASPIFWKTLEMFIPSALLYSFRNTGLWSHPTLHKMTSLRPQIRNISIGARLYGNSRDDSVVMLSMITCFVADLKFYSNLKRLTLTSVDIGRTLRSSDPGIQGQEIWESLSDTERCKKWDHVKSTQRVFGHSSHNKNYPCWVHFWRPVYELIMNWRSDPIKADICDTRPDKCEGSKSKPDPGMTFKIYHQNYKQLQFILKYLAVSELVELDVNPWLGEMPPLIYEAEIVQAVDGRPLVPQNIQLVGEHRAYWQQSDPPKQLSDIKGLPSLLITYPFWISQRE